MTAHAWPAAFREPIRWADPTPAPGAPIAVPAASHRAGPATPPAGLPHLEDVRPTYRDEPWASSSTEPRPYLAFVDEQARAPRTRRDPLPRELAHPAQPGGGHRPATAPEVRAGLAAIAAAPDAATRLGHARGVVGRMHHELEAHGRAALAVVQDPTAPGPARATADAQLVAWRTGILAVEAILAAIAGAPTELCDLPPDLRAP